MHKGDGGPAMSALGRKRSISSTAVAIEPLEQRRLLSAGGEAFVTQKNIVQDSPTANTQFVNAWGISFGPTTPFWIFEKGSGPTQAYNPSPKKVVFTRQVTPARPGGGP